MNLSFATRVRAGSLGPSGVILAGQPVPNPGDVVMITAVERSTFEANMPPASDIQAALVRPAALAPIYGDFVGGPRITRQAAVPAFVTTVVVPWAYGAALSAADRATFQAHLAGMVNAALQGVSSDFAPATFTPYDAAVNGPLAWWMSGAAQATRTRDAPGTGLERINGPDASAGPTPPAATNGNLRAVEVIAGLALAGVAVVQLGPVVASWLRRA